MKNYDKMPFAPPVLARAVRLLRKQNDWSQAQLAGQLGKHITTVARYETNRPPTGPVLLALAELARHPALASWFTGVYQLDKVHRDAEKLEDVLKTVRQGDIGSYSWRGGSMAELLNEIASPSHGEHDEHPGVQFTDAFRNPESHRDWMKPGVQIHDVFLTPEGRFDWKPREQFSDSFRAAESRPVRTSTGERFNQKSSGRGCTGLGTVEVKTPEEWRYVSGLLKLLRTERSALTYQALAFIELSLRGYMPAELMPEQPDVNNRKVRDPAATEIWDAEFTEQPNEDISEQEKRPR